MFDELRPSRIRERSRRVWPALISSVFKTNNLLSFVWNFFGISELIVSSTNWMKLLGLCMLLKFKMTLFIDLQEHQRIEPYHHDLLNCILLLDAEKQRSTWHSNRIVTHKMMKHAELEPFKCVLNGLRRAADPGPERIINDCGNCVVQAHISIQKCRKL